MCVCVLGAGGGAVSRCSVHESAASTPPSTHTLMDTQPGVGLVSTAVSACVLIGRKSRSCVINRQRATFTTTQTKPLWSGAEPV